MLIHGVMFTDIATGTTYYSHTDWSTPLYGNDINWYDVWYNTDRGRFAAYYDHDADWSVILKSQDIGLPSPKTTTVDIIGKDGTLDLTEAFGEVRYNNRTITFTFSAVENILDWDACKTMIANELHGKRMKITTWSDPDYYYIGRCTVDNYNSSKMQGTIVVKCDCEPYKIKHEATTEFIDAVSLKSIVIDSGRMTVYPTITVSEAMILVINGTSYSFAAGTYNNQLKFTYGGNTVTTTATSGTATFTFTEGAL